MALDRTVVKDNLKRIEKILTKSKKQFSEMGALITSFNDIYAYLEDIKSKTNLSKEDKKTVALIIKTTTLLDSYSGFCTDLFNLQSKISGIGIKLKETALFLETFRTVRKYNVKDPQKIFRFLSGFLDGFAEYYTFKPEFVGDSKTDDFVTRLDISKDGPYFKISYNVLPKAIEYAYSKRMKNFVIESHNLKLIFHKDYVITAYTENELIKKIDRIAKDLEIGLN
jgi:hypothetical protein